MNLSTDGLIIKVNNVGEYDRSVSVLTADYGVLRAFVHGSRSHKNKNAAATALLSYSHLTLQKRKDTFVITEATPEKVFFDLRGDIERLTLAQHFCELAYVLAPVDDNAKDYLRLVLNSLSFLFDGKRDASLLKAVTELRMLAISGYTPDLVACRECAKFEDTVMYFDTVNGALYCSECKPQGSGVISMGVGVLAALRHIVFSDFRSLYNFTLPPESMKTLCDITEKFLLSQVEHRFSALRFFKSL